MLSWSSYAFFFIIHSLKFVKILWSTNVYSFLLNPVKIHRNTWYHRYILHFSPDFYRRLYFLHCYVIFHPFCYFLLICVIFHPFLNFLLHWHSTHSCLVIKFPILLSKSWIFIIIPDWYSLLNFWIFQILILVKVLHKNLITYHLLNNIWYLNLLFQFYLSCKNI